MHDVDEETIRKYAKIMKEYDLSGIEITEDNISVRLEQQKMPGATEVISVPQIVQEQAVSSTNTTNNSHQVAPTLEQNASVNSYIEVRSPIVGVFYAAPTETSDPYVKVGDFVKKGDTLCIVEAMKLMNEVPAEQDGIIKEICVKNAQVVEHGTVLFRIES